MQKARGNETNTVVGSGKNGKTAILGISAFNRDSAAALIVDGQIVAAAQEERFSRRRHDKRFPENAVKYCLNKAELTPDEIDYVGFYDKPLLELERLHDVFVAHVPWGFRYFVSAVSDWMNHKLNLSRQIRRVLGGAYRKRIVFTEYQESHAASAFFSSPFDEAAILALDDVGNRATAAYGIGRGNRIELTHELHFPYSPGMLYSAFAYFCGFKVNSEQYRLMELASSGEPRFVDMILDKLVSLKEDGSIWVDMSYFNYCRGLMMTSRKFEHLFGGSPRRPEAPITQREMDIAASTQRVIAEILLRMARHIHAETGMNRLCLAGSTLLKCIVKGRLLQEGPFDDIWIQTAAGDAEGALGVAQFIWYQLLGNLRRAEDMNRQCDSLAEFSYGGDEIETLYRGTCAVAKIARTVNGDDSKSEGYDEVLADLLCDCDNSDTDDTDSVTEKVKAFYEANPFPNYDDCETLDSLIEKAKRSGLPMALDRAIHNDSSVLEVGCGTGQLANFLGISCRRVIGTDICRNSLRLADQFRRKHGIDRVRFVAMDVFKPCFKPERFDVIICSGVLHHTRDAFAGFNMLLPLLKPGGHIVIGLYNRYGRLPTDLRRHFFRATGGRLKWIDPVLRNKSLSAEQRRAWFSDQYAHPHESKHTIGEVINWFDRAGVEFVRCIFPGVAVQGCNLFEPQDRSTRVDRFLIQSREIFKGSGEGGLFLMIGRKPVEALP